MYTVCKPALIIITFAYNFSVDCCSCFAVSCLTNRLWNSKIKLRSTYVVLWLPPLSIWIVTTISIVFFWFKPGGGGGSPLYKLYRHVPPHLVGFFGRFGLKTGLDFAHFGLESGMVFGETTRLYERIYRFNSKWVRKKEKYANSKCIWSIFLFVL